MSLVVNVVSLVLVARLPVEDAKAVLFVILVHPFVRVTLGLPVLVSLLFLPFSVTVFQTVDELASVATSILPLVLPEPFRLSIAVLANVAVAIRKKVGSVSLAEALQPLSFILVAVGKDMDAIALRLRVHPLTDVRLAIGALPDTVAVFDAFQPLSVVDLSIFPLVNAFSICLSVLKGAMVRVPVRKDFETAPVSLVLEPLTLVDSTIQVNEHSKTFSLPLMVQLSSVDAVFILLDTKVGASADLIVIELIADHFILLHCVAVVFKLALVLA